MRPLLLLLVAVSVPTAAAQAQTDDPHLRRWIHAVIAHQPGRIDTPLQDIAALPAGALRTIARGFEGALRLEFRDLATRDEMRRRGALLHTDIALLLPDQAAAFKPADALPPPRLSELDRFGRPVDRQPATGVVYLVDGRYVASNVESGHWIFASRLLSDVRDATSDPFVQRWYRAVAATFLQEYRLGNAAHHLRRASEVLPRDAMMLFYAGALFETLASHRVRAAEAAPPVKVEMMMGQLTVAPDRDVPTERDQLQASERSFRDAVKHGAPPEARVRLGRVMGRLGKHADAVKVLQLADLPAGDARLAYLRDLFLGTEHGAIGRTEEARLCFERAAALYPTAQAPLIAIGDLFRRSGNRAAALDALRRLEALPADAARRDDPWWDYYRSYAADAQDQMEAVRAFFGAGGGGR